MNLLVPSRQGAAAFTEMTSYNTTFVGEISSVISRVEDDSPCSWESSIDELLRIRNLKDDWDGEGTEAPHPNLVDGAITLAQTLMARGVLPADRVFASVNGTIYFEWHTPLGYQEIEVTSPLDAERRWVQKSSDVATVVELSRRP